MGRTGFVQPDGLHVRPYGEADPPFKGPERLGYALGRGIVTEGLRAC
jgi:hypothetical protein